MIPSNYPERTGKHFIRCCNRQTPQSGDINIAGAILQHTGNILELSQERLSAEALPVFAFFDAFIVTCFVMWAVLRRYKEGSAPSFDLLLEWRCPHCGLRAHVSVPETWIADGRLVFVERTGDGA